MELWADEKVRAVIVSAPPTQGRIWHADHITRVADGGGLCDLDNLQTLCVVCHKRKTRLEAQVDGGHGGSGSDGGGHGHVVDTAAEMLASRPPGRRLRESAALSALELPSTSSPDAAGSPTGDSGGLLPAREQPSSIHSRTHIHDFPQPGLGPQPPPQRPSALAPMRRKPPRKRQRSPDPSSCRRGFGRGDPDADEVDGVDGGGDANGRILHTPPKASTHLLSSPLPPHASPHFSPCRRARRPRM